MLEKKRIPCANNLSHFAINKLLFMY